MLSKADQKLQENIEKRWESKIRPLLAPRSDKVKFLMTEAATTLTSYEKSATISMQYYLDEMQRMGYEIVDVKPIVLSASFVYFQILYK